MSVDFDVIEDKSWMDYVTGGSIIIDYGQCWVVTSYM